MKKTLAMLLGVCLVALLMASVDARNSVTALKIKAKDWWASPSAENVNPGLHGLYESAAVDTYYIVWYTFEQMNWQGWTRVDNTDQKGTFFHVENFVGISPGIHNHLIPLEGTKSMWCGARPNINDPYLCSWINAPGYGKNWNQYFTSPAFSFVGSINWSYKCNWDSEDGWDITQVEYDAGGGNWQVVAEWTGLGDTVINHLVTLPAVATKLRYRMTSNSNTDDEDGMLNADGAFIVDSIRVADDTGVIHFANFEAQAAGATTDGWWTASPAPGYGSFSGLKTNLADKDPCADNFGTQVVFFIGSTFPSDAYPGLYDTPFCMGPGNKRAPCQNEMIVSPVINMTKYSTAKNEVQDGTIPVGDLLLLDRTLFLWTVYRDLPDENCVFYTWQVRKLDPITGCPTAWYSLNFVCFGENKDYFFARQDVSRWIATNDPVQLGIGVIDMCDYWGTTTCNCAAHTPSPWFDQVRLLRYKTAGPQWRLVERGETQAYVPFTLCNRGTCDSLTTFNYTITGTGRIPCTVPCTSIAVASQACENVYAVLNAGSAATCTYDTLRIIVWTGTPAVYDTSFQVIHVVEPQSELAFRDSVTVLAEGYLNIYGLCADTIAMEGSADIAWSSSYPAGERLRIDTSIPRLELNGVLPDTSISIALELNDNIAPRGVALSVAAETEYPAEYSKEFFFKLSAPQLLPDTLYNHHPLQLRDTIYQMPPFFSRFSNDSSLVLGLYDQNCQRRGKLVVHNIYVIPYTPPTALVIVPEHPYSGIALPENDTLRVSAAMIGLPEPDSVTFYYRPSQGSNPFVPFYVDVDGTSELIATIKPSGSGDGWSGYLPLTSAFTQGADYDFVARFAFGGASVLTDTLRKFVDITPPCPKLTAGIDSVIVLVRNAINKLHFEVRQENDHIAVKAHAIKTEEFGRVLTPVNQHKTILAASREFACTPTAAASCLRYFADSKGWEKLKYPCGNKARKEMTPEQMASVLDYLMNTWKRKGTNAIYGLSGLRGYIFNTYYPGQRYDPRKLNWDITFVAPKSSDDYAKMVDEFGHKGEDIILNVKGGAPPNTLYHTITLSKITIGTSKGFESPLRSIEYMNPWTGKIESSHVTEDKQKKCWELTDYQMGNGANACIEGYYKVSPPPPEKELPRASSFSQESQWVVVDSIVARGYGQIDTLEWDTSSFENGVYILEVAATDDLGHTCTDTRFAIIPDSTTSTIGPGIVPGHTMLKRAFPNPFNAITTIEFAIEKRCEPSLAIYDARGSLVRLLISGKTMPSGIYTVRWDGRNNSGKPVASGVYLCRLSAGDTQKAIKIVLLR